MVKKFFMYQVIAEHNNGETWWTVSSIRIGENGQTTSIQPVRCMMPGDRMVMNIQLDVTGPDNAPLIDSADPKLRSAIEHLEAQLAEERDLNDKLRKFIKDSKSQEVK